MALYTEYFNTVNKGYRNILLILTDGTTTTKYWVSAALADLSGTPVTWAFQFEATNYLNDFESIFRNRGYTAAKAHADKYFQEITGAVPNPGSEPATGTSPTTSNWFWTYDLISKTISSEETSLP